MSVSIVGAGPGGIVTALLLAKQGVKVDVYEAKDRIGGRTTLLEDRSYRFDTGPTFYMGPFVLEEALAKVGIDINQHVTFHKLDPMYQLHYGDGLTYLARAEPADVKAELEKINQADGEGFLRFMETNRKRFADCYLRLLKRDFSTWQGLLTPDLVKLLFYRVDRSLYDELSRFFTDWHSILAFTFQAKYIGMSPHTAPSFFTLLSFIEYQFGNWHPMGGFWNLLETMKRLAAKEGATFHLGTEVDRVLVEQGRAVGVQIGSEKIHSTQTIVNADLPYSMKHLIPSEHRKRYTDAWLDKAGYSCSTVMFYWGIKRKLQELQHHNIFLAKDYNENLQDIYTHRRVRADASFYAWNPSLLDPFYADDGHSILYVLFPTTNLEAEVNWEQAVDTLRETALNRLEQHGITDIRQQIAAEKVHTPPTWSADYNVFKGATFNLAHNLRQIGPFRPSNRDKDIANLFWVGGGTHPGSGLPTIFKGAENTVSLVLRDEAKPQSSSVRPAVAR